MLGYTPEGPSARSRTMTNSIQSRQASGTVDTAVSDYFYFEDGYYHRVSAVENRERTETPALVAA
jgi:hypothetical protein